MKKIAKNFRKPADVINDSQQDPALLQLAEPDAQMIFETLKLKHHFLWKEGGGSKHHGSLR